MLCILLQPKISHSGLTWSLWHSGYPALSASCQRPGWSPGQATTVPSPNKSATAYSGAAERLSGEG